MFCPNCGKENEGAFCMNCGTPIAVKSAPEEPQPQPTPVQPQSWQDVGYRRELTEEDLPAKYRPMSAWAYFGWNLLFAIPIVGFILLLVFSFSNDNINRRNYARSFWCALLILAILVVIGLIMGVSFFGALGSAF